MSIKDNRSIKDELKKFQSRHKGWLPGSLDLLLEAEWADNKYIANCAASEVQRIYGIPEGNGLGMRTQNERDFAIAFAWLVKDEEG